MVYRTNQVVGSLKSPKLFFDQYSTLIEMCINIKSITTKFIFKTGFYKIRLFPQDYFKYPLKPEYKLKQKFENKTQDLKIT